MTFYLLLLALLLLGYSVFGFYRNRTAISNVVVCALGFAALVAWLALATGSEGIVTAIAAIFLVLGLMALPVLVVALLANGLVMIRKESRSLGNLLSLLVGLAILAMAWSFTKIFEGDINPFLGWGWIGAAIVLAYVSIAFVLYLLASWLYSTVPTNIKPRYGIVLGARLIDGKVPPLLRSRLDRGVEIMAEYDAKGQPISLIPTGGQGLDESKPEGVGMAEYLESVGVPADRIIVEDKAVNTRENLILSRALMDDPNAPAAIITNNYHVFRAALLARKIGLNAHVFGAKTKFYYLPSAVIREFLAIMVQHKILNALVILLLLSYAASGLIGMLRN